MNVTTKNMPAPARATKVRREPRVLAAPGMLDQRSAAVREDGESDLRYQSRSALFDLLAERAKED